ncbi:four-carbon acid sugar kinase family protein [Geodermatophilus sp. URMC 61]|uniref:four-carbon acid sugar kinase family protein n=1 Tax=Geodermatophilus sp. URMC 61 TaxID=3423411 RepID=UPI00406CAC54
MADIGFLADDLTGASDVLAQAHAYGLDAMLVLDPGRSMPDDADVVGIAGPARSLAGDALDEAVRSGLAPLASLDLSVLLYKVCSTFDSSPTVGSIGRGIELLHERFPGHGPVPVVPAQPGFGRYTAFSQHFGAYAGEVYRLDRHPVMARHPSTPMCEADLRLVLAEQLASRRPVPGLQLPAHADGSFDDRWAQLRGAADAEAFVVDAVDEAQMDTVAKALLRDPRRAGPALVVGSGGIMAALARLRGGAPRRPPAPTASRGPTLVVSASASTTTAGQIADAVRHGWVDVPIPAGDVAGDVTGKPWSAAVEAALRAGRDVVAHTTRGPDDPRLSVGSVTAAEVGGTIGRLAGDLARRGLTRDVVVCGGDTSSHALLAMGVGELRVSEQFVTAGPICTTDDAAAVAGCRVLLKGGQVGPPDLFRRFAGLV